MYVIGAGVKRGRLGFHLSIAKTSVSQAKVLRASAEAEIGLFQSLYLTVGIGSNSYEVDYFSRSKRSYFKIPYGLGYESPLGGVSDRLSLFWKIENEVVFKKVTKFDSQRSPEFVTNGGVNNMNVSFSVALRVYLGVSGKPRD